MIHLRYTPATTMTALALLFVMGCATPNPAVTHAASGKRYYTKRLIPEALDSFNRSADLDPSVMAHKRYAKHRVMYEDCQIVHGMEQAAAAEAAGDLARAWSYYHCVAQLASEREEVSTAKLEADRVARILPESYLARAREALDRGDRAEAHAWATQCAILDGGDAARSLLAELLDDEPFDGEAPELPRVELASMVRPPVRTDLVDRVVGRKHHLVEGVAVFYGEPHAYYEELGETQYGGYPSNVLPVLAARTKKKGGNALVNVSVRYKGENPVTSATMARLISFE